MGIKPGPKRIAKSTGKPDRRQRDNKETPGNTPSLKPHNHKRGTKNMPLDILSSGIFFLQTEIGSLYLFLHETVYFSFSPLYIDTKVN